VCTILCCQFQRQLGHSYLFFSPTMQCTQSVWAFISACCNMIFTAEAFRFCTVVFTVQYLCTLGYGDFNNLFGFSCVVVLLTMFVLKVVQINKSSLIRFTNFTLLFTHCFEFLQIFFGRWVSKKCRILR
jgi:hypothetical protein